MPATSRETIRAWLAGWLFVSLSGPRGGRAWLRLAECCGANGKLQTTCTDNGQPGREKLANLDATPSIIIFKKLIHQPIYELKIIKLSQNSKHFN